MILICYFKVMNFFFCICIINIFANIFMKVESPFKITNFDTHIDQLPAKISSQLNCPKDREKLKKNLFGY